MTTTRIDSEAPVLRSASRGGFTSASLRDYYRWRIRQIDGMDRQRYAYNVLNNLLQGVGGDWSRTELRAVALGLELGMNEGIR